MYSNKRDEEPGDGHDNGRLGSGGKDWEELKLSHKEITYLLKSALQDASTEKEARKIKNESSGATGVSSDISYHC